MENAVGGVGERDVPQKETNKEAKKGAFQQGIQQHDLWPLLPVNLFLLTQASFHFY